MTTNWVAALSGSPLVHLRSSHAPAQTLSHRCAARRSPGNAHRMGTMPVLVVASWLHRGGMAAPSPWRCTWLTRLHDGPPLWIGHCLWQDGTRALERALPTPEHSPDRARVLCSMHRLAWTHVETGLDDSGATSMSRASSIERVITVTRCVVTACNPRLYSNVLRL